MGWRVVGGLLAYAKRGSNASLAGGVASGLLLLLLVGFVSLKAFEKRRNSYLAMLSETVCSLTLTYVMGQRYLQTSKIMPAGVVAVVSAFMTVFYLYKFPTGGNHISSKAE